jgi:putative hydrolase
MADDPPPDEGDKPEKGDTPDDGSAVPNPFSAFPMFADIARALQSQGPLNWDAARQFAMLGATEGGSEANVDPEVRIAYADLARIAAMHVNDVIGSDTVFPEARIVTRGQWTGETLEAYRPLFTDLATSLGQGSTATEVEPTGDPFVQMLSGLGRMMGPAMMGMAVGSMVGSLAKRVFGLHDLPIPRSKQEIVLVGSNIDSFATEWEIPVDEMRLWVLSHELSGFQILSVTHLRDTLADLVRKHVGGFRPDPNAIADKLGSFDPFSGEDSGDPTEALQRLFGDPEVLLGAVRSPEQVALQPQLDAAVAAVVGYTDWVVDAVAVRVVGGEALRIAEAVRRQRAGTAAEDTFVEQLLGIRLGDDQVTRGKNFVQGVVDRVGEPGLTRLLALPDSMPTPNEIGAPGLWIARVSGD